jgi:hypothetical protein
MTENPEQFNDLKFWVTNFILQLRFRDVKVLFQVTQQIVSKRVYMTQIFNS